jgi:uncharacterized protein YydD (DUF2326 family)
MMIALTFAPLTAKAPAIGRGAQIPLHGPPKDKGHSYHRLLCALFDLSVLKALETQPFYHFVYHDGGDAENNVVLGEEPSSP